LEERTKDPREITIFTPANDTIRGRADSFVEMFQIELDKLESNTLNKMGIYPGLLLALIDSLLIISHDKKYFLYEHYFIVCNYVALNFQKTDLLRNKTFLYFIFEFSLLLHINISFIKMRISLDNIELPFFVMNADEQELINQKLNAYSINAQIDSIDDLQYKYHVSIIAPLLEKNVSVFIEEKTSTYLFGKYVRAESLSDHFRTTILENNKKLTESISYKRERITRYLESLNSELQLIKDKPIVNSFLKDVEKDLVKQIRKWEGKISKQNIEEWLLNFDSRSDKLLALKILDKISYVTYQDLLILSRQLYKRIKSTLGDISLDECAFSYVGDITSGSVHIVRLFQEENKIERNLFVDSGRITKISSSRILFLLDDFVGCGNTFIQWFNENLNRITGSKFDRIYYCVLTAFDKGVKKIEEQTKIQTISAYLYEQSSMVIDGDLFNDIERKQIKSLIEKYHSRLPNKFLYGYDDCQLLVAFESNIPNNSISLLWGTECWTPLLERK
jgi:hypothetical protein